eukprot:1156077-Pelagomonas_calceolata.AAC.2
MEQNIRHGLSILWLLNTVPHCYHGKQGAVHECGMVTREMAALFLLQLSCPHRQGKRKDPTVSDGTNSESYQKHS